MFGYIVSVVGGRVFRTFSVANGSQISEVAFPSSSHSIYAISYDLSCALLGTGVNGSQLVIQQLQRQESVNFKTFTSGIDAGYAMNVDGSIIVESLPQANGNVGLLNVY